MLETTCLCGQVRVAIAARPDFLHDCNCTLCSGTGARWAYLPPDQVIVTGETHGWSRGDKLEAGAEIRFCPTCGTTTHFVLTPATIARFGDTMVGVNLRLVDERTLAGIELRFPDGRAWSGAGEFGYVREPRMLGT